MMTHLSRWVVKALSGYRLLNAYFIHNYGNNEFLAHTFHRPVSLIEMETVRRQHGRNCHKIKKGRKKCSALGSRTPARSAIQLLNRSRPWKSLRRPPLARVIATWADRNSVRNATAEAMGISSRHRGDNTVVVWWRDSPRCQQWRSREHWIHMW